MKKTVFTLVLGTVMSFISLGANAQIVSSHSNSITYSSSSVGFKNYSRIEFSYAPIAWGGDAGEDADTWTGIKLGYLHGYSLSNNIPLFLEAGANVQYAWYSEDNVDAKILNVNIPINVAYKFFIPNSAVAITPYAGLHIRGNIIGEEDNDNHRYDRDYFDDNDAKRVQLGGQIGVGLDYKALYVGLSYNPQFTEYMKKLSSYSFNITLGVNL